MSKSDFDNFTGTQHSSHKIKVFHTLKDIAPQDWDGISPTSFPFAGYRYLLALEESGSIGEKTGWIPYYITVWKDGKLEGATYLYLKNHSYGEYIFDWEWARAYQANGVAYYPKLVSAVPFTPATGNKLLLAGDCETQIVSALLIQSALKLIEPTKSSSMHFLFISENEIPFFEAQGLKIRHSFQYHWKNNGYRSFADFTDAFKAKKGKQILRERAQLKESGVAIESFTGGGLEAEHAELMYGFYRSTIEKMGAIPYLTPDFFTRVFETMPEQILFLLVKKDGRPIAGSISYYQGDCLYGRYWGAVEEVRNLHFELCYYRLIEFAIANKIKRFEAGAQGEHKIQRGFLPELTYSAHSIVHPEFRRAISEFIAQEVKAIDAVRLEMLSHSPFKAT